VECKFISGKTLQVMKGEEMNAMIKLWCREINKQIFVFLYLCFRLYVFVWERERQRISRTKQWKLWLLSFEL